MTTIDHIFAFPDKPTADKVLVQLGLATQEADPDTEATIIVAASGVDIAKVPVSVERAPAVRDKQGSVVTPAVVDTRYMLAVRLSGANAKAEMRGRTQTENDGRLKSIFDRTALGAQFKAGTSKDDYVSSRVLSFGSDIVELIDPDSWPGGMPERVWQ